MGDGPPGFSRDFPCPAILRNLPSEPALFRLPGSHRLWPTVPSRSTRGLVCDSPASRPDRPCNPGVRARRFGLFRVRSPLLAESLLFSFPAGTEMVHFPALSSTAYGFSRGYPGITLGGLPHSEISGSTPVCGSPKLIAAYRVLHRLLAPRHPPYALSSLTTLGSRPRVRASSPPEGRFPRDGTRSPARRPAPKDTCVITESYRLQRIRLSQNGGRPPVSGGPTTKPPDGAGDVRRRVVENTGLEPVTSWLQTRRSPS